MSKIIGEKELDAIFCVAGGWLGGNAADKDMVKNAEIMYKQSVWSSVISAHLASKYLNDGGLLQLTGAAAVSFIFFYNALLLFCCFTHLFYSVIF